MSQAILTEQWLTSEWLAWVGRNVALKLVIPKEAGFRGIVDQAFMGFKGEEVVLPEGLIYIGRNAFKDLENLRRVVLPEGLECIDMGAFSGCVNLEDVVLPKSLIYLRREAFRDCASIEKIVIPGSVNIVEQYAFYQCSALEELKIENGVLRLERFAFGRCAALRSFRRRDLPRSVEKKMRMSDTRIVDTFEWAFGGSPCVQSARKRAKQAKAAELTNQMFMPLMR